VNWIHAWWQEVSGTAAQGLEITLVGMALVFLTLGLIIVALVLLTRLPRPSPTPQKEPDVATDAPPERTTVSTAKETRDAQPELAQVAAIAVALLRSRRTRSARPKPGARSSRWKQYGRAHQLGL
jgi:Na+-transporting methylmalonyl-CoA/oxaloacetate decarboxylase gamma subunit